VSAAGAPLLIRLLERAPLRRLREVAFSIACRLRLRQLDRTRADRAQLRTLLGMVHRARRTRFGRDHDLARVRSAEDFRRLVPLRTPALLAREGAPSDSAAMAASHRSALATAFALLQDHDPRTPLLSGRIAWRGDRLTFAHLPILTRPSLTAANDAPIVCTIETIDGIAACVSRADQRLELLALPEAPVAVEDRRHGGLRLLADHGVYFEFVPADRVEERSPSRLALGEVRPGEPYELAVTSPAGWWACRSGLFVVFERIEPPILRVVPAPVRPEPITSSPAPHRRIGGTPAALPETSVHSPWSVPADRG
jgi:hypothetical protein